MHYPNKPFLHRLFILALFLLPMAQTASGEPPQQANQLQTELIEANQRIVLLTSDHQRIAGTITALQTSLNTAHQEISDLKIKHHQLEGAQAGARRTANGHGR